MNSCRSSGAPSKSSSAAIISACQLIEVSPFRCRSFSALELGWSGLITRVDGPRRRAATVSGYTVSAFDGSAREAGDELPVRQDVSDQGRDRDKQDVHKQQVIEAQILALKGK